jgi:hypothetical protein
MEIRKLEPPTGRPAAVRALGVLAVLLALIGGLIPAAGAAQTDAPPDLAAMALTPPDVAAEGLDGYGSSQGRWLSSDQVVDMFVDGGLTRREARALVHDHGLTGLYIGRVALASEPGNGGSIATHGVISYLYAFEDEAGAKAFVEDWTDLAFDDPSAGIEEVAGDERIGDESRLIRWTFEEPESGAPGVELQLAFRTEQVYAELGVFDVALDGEDAEPEEPAISAVEALGERLLERIEAVLDGEASNLSTRALRLESDDPLTTNNADRYVAIDGEVFLYYGRSPEDVDPHAESYAAAGIIDAYTFEQVFPNDAGLIYDNLG